MNQLTAGAEKTENIADEDKILILHITTDLKYGGAQMMLLKLLASTNTKRFQPVVVSLAGPGDLTSKIQELGIHVYSLNVNPAIPSPLKLIQLVRFTRKLRPAIVQTWMYHADLFGGIAAKIAGAKQIVWNIRNSGLAPESTKLRTRITVHICSLLSHVVPNKIITNSSVAASTHKANGYRKNIFRIIPNGFDPTILKADESTKSAVRKELGLAHESRLIGLIARFHPQKNHRGFLEAAAILNKQRKGQVYLLAGGEVDPGNSQLKGWIEQLDLSKSVILLGQRDDIPRIIASLDICALSSSYGEAFPNVIGEAMCCEVPVVTTDVGDSARIVGDAGKIVPIDQPELMAEAWHFLLSLNEGQRQTYGELGRQRILDYYSLAKITSMYENFYTELLEQELAEEK